MSADNPPIVLSKTHNGSLVRKAFFIESILNLGVLPVITHPHAVLSAILIDKSQVTPATILLARVFSGLVVAGLNTALWMGLPNTRNAIESRRTTYYTLGMGEAIIIPMLLVEAAKKGGIDAALSVHACWAGIASLAPLLIWRAYVLFVDPNMLGQYKEIKRD